MALAQQACEYYTDYRRVVAGLCSGCVLQLTCISQCRRLRNLNHLVDEYELLEKAYKRACAELSLGSNYFKDFNVEQVEDMFKEDAQKG